MKISPPLAQKIVDNLKKTLNQQINFMNIDGLIIASTNKRRIDSLHEGAIFVTKTKKSLFIEYDGQYKGAKKGINMPIHFENEIIGVIGITGEREVKKYAEIVKAMTEILIKEAYLNEVSFKSREKNRFIIESLLLNTQESFDESLLDINFATPYRVIVGSFISNKQNISQLYSLLESFLLHHSKNFFTIMQTHIILIIPQMSIDSLLRNIQQAAYKQYKIEINFGIGIVSYETNELKKSFETAKHTLHWMQTLKQEQQICYFENLDLGILLCQIPQENTNFFVDKIFQSIPQQDIEYYSLIINTFCKHNGSIQKSANELFIHKNTLQYQLNKIKKITGYDPRNYYDFTVLYIAFLFESTIALPK